MNSDNIWLGEDGRAEVSALPILMLLSIGLLGMAFLENASSEIIGGIMGGVIVLWAAALWYRFFIFKIRYLAHKKDTTTKPRQCTSIRTNVGESSCRVSIMPRRGMIMTAIHITFFEKGRVFWSHGVRRDSDDIKVIKFCFQPPRKKEFTNIPLDIDKDGSYAELGSTSLAGGTLIYVDLVFEVSGMMKTWEGMISFKIHYVRDGNPVSNCVRTKFIVRASDKKRPIRSIGKSLLVCETTKCK